MLVLQQASVAVGESNTHVVPQKTVLLVGQVDVRSACRYRHLLRNQRHDQYPQHYHQQRWARAKQPAAVSNGLTGVSVKVTVNAGPGLLIKAASPGAGMPALPDEDTAQPETCHKHGRSTVL